MVVNDTLWEDIMNKWLSHYLYDVNNDIEDMPTVSVQSNVDGSFRTYDTWSDFKYRTFEYDKKVNPDNFNHVDTTAIGSTFAKYYQRTDEFGRESIRDNYYLSLPDSVHAKYVFEVPDDYTFTGVPEVHLKLSTKDVDKDGLVVSALLLDTIDEETSFKAYMTKNKLYNTLPTKAFAAAETGGGLPYTKVKEYIKSNTTAKLITFGYTDLKNPGGGYEGKDYRRRTEEMNAGEYYDYTIYLMPTSYTFEPGHKAVLIITGWDPYNDILDEDFKNGLITDSVDSAYTYAFNIDNEALEMRFPVIAGSPEDVATPSELDKEDREEILATESDLKRKDNIATESEAKKN
jgi:X-Pro dipeptidyl-peptidase